MRKCATWGFLTALILVVALAGCATFSNVKPWSERTPQEKSLTFLQLYNAQFADTMRLANTQGLTEGQKDVVRVKKKILSEVRHLIDLYDGYTRGGIVPSFDLETRIIGMLDELARKGG